MKNSTRIAPSSLKQRMEWLLCAGQPLSRDFSRAACTISTSVIDTSSATIGHLSFQHITLGLGGNFPENATRTRSYSRTYSSSTEDSMLSSIALFSGVFEIIFGIFWLAQVIHKPPTDQPP